MLYLINIIKAALADKDEIALATARELVNGHMTDDQFNRLVVSLSK